MNVPELHQYFVDVARDRQCLGECDCVTFVVDVLRVGFDKDYREHLHYNDRRSAVNQLRAMGGLRDAAASTFGLEVEPCELRQGDVAYLEMPTATIGVVMNGFIAVRGDNCIHRISVDSALVGWRVP